MIHYPIISLAEFVKIYGSRKWVAGAHPGAHPFAHLSAEHPDCTTFTTERYGGRRWLICVDCDAEVAPVPLCAAQPCKQYAKILDGDSLCYGHRHYWGAGE